MLAEGGIRIFRVEGIEQQGVARLNGRALPVIKLLRMQQFLRDPALGDYRQLAGERVMAGQVVSAGV